MAKKRKLIKDMTRVGRRVRAQRKQSNSPLWRRKALAMWSLLARASGVCDVCGVTSTVARLDAHHILPRERYQWLAFELLNAVCLCQKHHKLARFSAHRNPIWFTFWLESSLPGKYIWALDHLYDTPAEPPDFRETYERLRGIAVSRGLIEHDKPE